MKLCPPTTLFIVGALMGCTTTPGASLQVTPSTHLETANYNAPNSVPIKMEFTVKRAEQLAKAALNDGDIDALRDLKRGAQDEVAASRYGLALFYFSSTMFTTADSTAGDGIALSYALLRQSAAQSLPASEYRLCWFQKMNGPAGWPRIEPGEAAQWCERASNDGVAAADLMLGQMAIDGAYFPSCPSREGPDDHGVVDPSCSDRIAIARLRRAASAGLERAQFRLGTLLRNKGSPDGKKEGARWLMLAAAHAQLDDDDAWDGRWVRKPDWAASPAACAATASLPIPKPDLPARAATQDLADCDSEQLYYGIGRSADFVKARWCAYLERPALASANTWGAPAFVGPAILMMTYANGRGVPRNIPLARKFACEEQGAPAEISSRFAHLDEIEADPHAAPIDVCDDITSGMMMGACAARKSDIAEANRVVHDEEIKLRLTPEAQTAFEALRDAATQFIQAQSGNEVDTSGTGRDAFVAEQSDQDWQAFTQLLDGTFTRELLPASTGDVSIAHRELDDAYRELLGGPGFEPFEGGLSSLAYGTIQKSGIGAAQDVWQPYAAAWSRFAQTIDEGRVQSAVDWAVVETRLGQIQKLAAMGRHARFEAGQSRTPWVAPGTFQPSAAFQRTGELADQAIAGNTHAYASLQRAAEQRDVDAATWFAVVEHRAGNEASAAHWTKAAAEQGQPIAEGFLGSLYNRGWGMPEDPRIAQLWWLHSARSGVATAMFDLGTTLASGRGHSAAPELGLALMEAAKKLGASNPVIDNAIAATRAHLDNMQLISADGRAEEFANAPASIPAP